MIDQSFFQIPCECGAVVRSHEPETVCPKCKALLVVEWGTPPSKREAVAEAYSEGAPSELNNL